MRSLAKALAASIVALMATTGLGLAADKPHQLALQISDNSAEKMTAVLNVAANVTKHYAERGEEVQVRIVAFNAGLDMLREDKSPVKERVANFAPDYAP